VINDMLELYKIVPALKFPVFIKVLESAASIGLLKVKDRDDLIYEYKNLVNQYNLKPKDYPILQQSVEGRDYCVTALYNTGKMRAMMTYVNIKCHPYKSGPGVYRKNIKVPEMEKQARKFLDAIKWHGVIELDYRMGRDRKPYLIEANPRFWGGLNQSVASNVNYPLLAYKIAMDGDCPPVKRYDAKVRTENLTTAVMALFDEIKKDEKKQKELSKLQNHWKKFMKGDAKSFGRFIDQLKFLHKKRYTSRIIEEFLNRRKLVKDDILDVEDPWVVMGIFYPVQLFLKYGRVDKMMLTGENPQK